jgi:hypothetical protein
MLDNRLSVGERPVFSPESNQGSGIGDIMASSRPPRWQHRRR